MPSGACVVRYEGKRGVVWRIKFADASGRQVMETVGAERDGWTRKKAREALDDRLSDVRRKGYRRPKRLTFAEYADAWLEEGKGRRDWKPRTLLVYRTALRHLQATFGTLPLGAIRPRDVTAYVSDALAEFAPKTVNLHLN